MRLQLLIPIVAILSSSIAFSIVWWAWQRRREREAYYRYEISRLMIERYGDSQEKFISWLQEQQAGDERRGREAFQLLAAILIAGGIGALAGIGITPRDETLFGWVPIGTGVGIVSWLLLSRRRSSSSAA